MTFKNLIQSNVSITSSSEPSISTIYINDNSCILITKLINFKEIYFSLVLDDLKIKLLFGNLTINEYNLNENETIDVYADRDHNLFCRIDYDSKYDLEAFKNFLAHLSNFNRTIIEEINRLKLTSINASFMVLYVERNSDPLNLKFSYLIGRNVEMNWIKIEQKEQDIVLRDDWKSCLVNDLESHLENHLKDTDQTTSSKKSKNQIIMVCGGRNSGKSTLIKHLINRQLKSSKLSNRKIYYLDLDPGQSEFTNSGQLTFVEIDKPILFPTYINVAKFKNQIIFSSSVCSTNVEDLGSLYSENLANLWFKIQEFIKPNDIIFVNTMGFVRIIGFMMLVDAIKLIKPNHLIEIKFEIPSQIKNLYDINFQIDLKAKEVISTKGWLGFDVDRLRLKYNYIKLTNQYELFNVKKNKLKRINAQLVYLSLIDSLLERPINHLQPYPIRFKDVKIHLAIENQPEDQLILDILNCSWIQLCRLDGDDDQSIDENFKIIRNFSSNQCLGNAFIRNIDLKNKIFYILTPEHIDTIKQVNCFVKSNSINVPKEVFMSQMIYSKTKPIYIDVNF